VTPVYVECDQKATKGNIHTSAISCEINGCLLYPRHHTCIYELIFNESRGLALMSKVFGVKLLPICIYLEEVEERACWLFASLAGSSSPSFASP
jgi:hypothetical protein